MSFERFLNATSTIAGGRLSGLSVMRHLYTIVVQMLDDRKLVSDALRMPSAENDEEILRRIVHSEILLRARSAHGSDEETLVLFCPEERSGVKWVRQLSESYPGAHFVIASAEGPTPFLKREASEKQLDVEWWLFSELLINPTRHTLVPSHTPLAPDEAKRLERELCVLPHQWPKIRSTDIIVRWLRIPVGTVVRCARSGLMPERALHYRKVVE